MSVTGIVGVSTAQIKSILSLQSQLDDLQRQLGTGQKSNTYAGLGLDRGFSMALRSQQSAVQSYQQTSTVVGTRLTIAQSALTQIDGAAHVVKSTTTNPVFSLNQIGQTIDQTTAAGQLDQIIGSLNTQVGNQYIFSGKSADVRPVESADHILNGFGGQAGLIQLIAERKQADLGSNSLGRLVVPAPAAAPASLVGAGAAVPTAAVATVSGNANLNGAYTSAGGTIVINGQTINIAAGANAAAVLAAINAPGVVAATKVTASLDGSNQLVLTSNDDDATITVGAGSTLLAEVGLTAAGGMTTNPTNLLTQGALPGVVTAGQTLTITITGHPPVTITFGTNEGAAPPEVSTLAELNTQLATLVSGGSAATAQADAAGNITLTALNSTDTIAITGSANPAVFGLQAATAPPSGAVSISEDVTGSVFGFKLASYNNTLTGATVTTSGPPSGYTVNFKANPVPKAGDAITFNFNLPDGTTSAVTLTATTANPPDTNQFTIGTSPATTAANFQAALTTAVGTQAKTSLTAASAMAASNDFFNIDDTHPPMRVNGPPFDTATSLIAGTSTNTVRWYTGEGDGTPARAGATARVDSAITVSYGMRANEQALRTTVSSIAVFASMTFSASDPNAAAAFQQVAQRVGTVLSVPAGAQKIPDIEAEIANSQVIMKGATDRQTQTQSAISAMLDSVQGVPTEEIGAQILAMQTRLQASLQTTALLAKTTLVNYLSP
jgi:hypothetical protein